ncbi:hypothetical protein TNCV_4951161 [Trichonephila clavipes]|nr:hypothetical protein TNCV_4951161 [Trichonephila clavipes]
MHSRTNDNSRAALRRYHEQFPNRRILNHRMFQGLHRQLRETHSFHVTRHDADRRSAVRSPSLAERILNIEADRPESSTSVVAHHVSVSHQTVCGMLNENHLRIFHFQSVQTLNPENYYLPVCQRMLQQCTLQRDLIVHLPSSCSKH